MKILLVVLLAAVGCHPAIVVQGRTQDCFEGAADAVSSVPVAVFGLGDARELAAKLKQMDSVPFVDGDPTSMNRFAVEYSEMVSLVNRSHAIKRFTTSSDGRFSFTLKSADSLLLVGHKSVEDQPFYYAYSAIPSDSSLSVILDMSRGQCP